MAGLNWLIVQGRVGALPIIDETPKGDTYGRFDVCWQWRKNTKPHWMTFFMRGEERLKILMGMKLQPGDYVLVEGALRTDHPREECKINHYTLTAYKINLLLRARSSEEKHYEDIEREDFGGEKPAPF